MIEITLKTGDDFLKIKETLTRIGIANKAEKKLYQSCHILHEDGRYYITHFKELIARERGVPSFMDDEDNVRMRVVANLLVEWKLCIPKEPLKGVDEEIVLYIINFKEKGDWNLIPKFKLGGE